MPCRLPTLNGDVTTGRSWPRRAAQHRQREGGRERERERERDEEFATNKRDTTPFRHGPHISAYFCMYKPTPTRRCTRARGGVLWLFVRYNTLVYLMCDRPTTALLRGQLRHYHRWTVRRPRLHRHAPCHS